MDKDFNEFCNFLFKNNFSANLIKGFKIYQSILAEKNQKLNLISKNSLDRIWSAHFLDSILICDEINFSNKTVLDFGSGAGFPGIPIKILYPTMQIFLLESVRKKVLFLRYLLEKLDLQEYEIINNRIENLDISFNKNFDFILIRAVKMKKIYYEKCFQLLKNDGIIILYKGKEFQEKVVRLKHLNPNRDIKIIKKRYPDIGMRNYVIVQKVTNYR
ncbi:MAG: 16S rRNA (guanine(527)-N(7))-methyltransferase RsmG [Candidatus Cloacimonadota bacterium]|nr:16S rRNA (guanine(527)-N(7))-methyltransferase RsmG [Candidatus Cloacimonadota bacterium]